MPKVAATYPEICRLPPILITWRFEGIRCDHQIAIYFKFKILTILLLKLIFIQN